ncbi:MAG TPA: VWA domain-containing protein, partial [Pyrinomonadaceae bacterium]|nr:VWA domain-containing protein [Pyrinomonadaceae bacterium]
MRRLFAAALLLSLLASSFNVFAQTRPRRANPGGATTPHARTTTAPRPTPHAPTTRTSNAPAEQESEEVDEGEVVRVNTSLVTIPVSVLDRDGKYVAGIRKEEFRVYEDGVEQDIAYFAQVDVPFTVALVIDTSGSTRFRLEEIQDAAVAFVEQLKPNDRVLVVSFDEEVRVHAEPTSDRRRLRDAIRETRTGGYTKLYD